MDLFAVLILILISAFSSLATNAGGGGGVLSFTVHRRFRGASVDHDRSRHLAAAVDVPLGRNGRSVGLYYAQLRIGSPANKYYALVDTGSDLSWLKCNKKDLYYPDESIAATVIPCDHDLCYHEACKRGSHCNYRLSYADGSSSSGYLVSDRLEFDFVSGNFSTSILNTSIVLGCGVHQDGSLTVRGPGLDGIVAFGRSKVSFISQLAQIGVVENRFAHCLDAEFSGGIFVLGRVEHPKVNTIPLIKDRLKGAGGA